MHAMEPVDEEIWASILADPLDCPPSYATIHLPSQVEEYVNFVYNNYGMEVDHSIEEPQDKTWQDLYLGELIPKENWKRGPRAPRKRRTFQPWQRRKNKAHWTNEEVIKLVEGVETYGIGRWKKVKDHYFSKTSFRDAHSEKEKPDRIGENLKDKWRNLLRACGVPCNSKKKKKRQKKFIVPLDTELIERIKAASRAAGHSPRRRTTRSRKQLMV
uniref:Uncharacterized protein n=1 Tax=Avena sativa TaxID=4498 RepID=A0ACD5TL64_AVESA